MKKALQILMLLMTCATLSGCVVQVEDGQVDATACHQAADLAAFGDDGEPGVGRTERAGDVVDDVVGIGGDENVHGGDVTGWVGTGGSGWT